MLLSSFLYSFYILFLCFVFCFLFGPRLYLGKVLESVGLTIWQKSYERNIFTVSASLLVCCVCCFCFPFSVIRILYMFVFVAQCKNLRQTKSAFYCCCCSVNYRTIHDFFAFILNSIFFFLDFYLFSVTFAVCNKCCVYLIVRQFFFCFVPIIEYSIQLYINIFFYYTPQIASSSPLPDPLSPFILSSRVLARRETARLEKLIAHNVACFSYAFPQHFPLITHPSSGFLYIRDYIHKYIFS